MFTVINNEENLLQYYHRYAKLRPNFMDHNRFFLNYKNGKCSRQPVGKNTFGSLPQKIAAFLKLPEPSLYTGHCFRRTSATFLADSGADITNLKRHGGWKSSTVAEGYIEESVQQKIETAEKILGRQSFPKQQLPSTSTCSSSTCLVGGQKINNLVDISCQNTNFQQSSTTIPSVILNNCTNCKIEVKIEVSSNK